MFSYVSAAQDGRFPFVLDFTEQSGSPTLIVLYGGRFSRQIQADWTDDEIMADILSLLEEVYGVTPPDTVDSYVTRWSKDPFSLGSYSYIPVGASPADFEALATPVGERLLFAGEATAWEHHATAHGALISGLRAAKQLGVTEVQIPGLE